MQWLPRFVLQMLPVPTAAPAVQPYREDVVFRCQPPVLPAGPQALDDRGAALLRLGESRSLSPRFDSGGLALSIEPATH